MIQSSGLEYRYPGSQETLAFADMDVAQGAVLVLKGNSGTGKSTWLALVAALMPPSAGQLVVAGQYLPKMGGAASDAWRARHLGFLPQKLHLTPALSVLDNLRMAQWAAGVAEDRARIGAVLDSLGVAPLAHRLPTQLSGGQAQRVALARAVLLQPSVLLADEPTASLDDGAARESVELLVLTAQTHNATLVIATHDRRVGEVLTQRPSPLPSVAEMLLAGPQGSAGGTP